MGQAGAGVTACSTPKGPPPPGRQPALPATCPSARPSTFPTLASANKRRAVGTTCTRWNLRSLGHACWFSQVPAGRTFCQEPLANLEPRLVLHQGLTFLAGHPFCYSGWLVGQDELMCIDVWVALGPVCGLGHPSHPVGMPGQASHLHWR